MIMEKIIMRQWRGAEEITPERMSADMRHADRVGMDVHAWSGEDRSGSPLAVTWVAGPRTGCALTWYEITGGE